MKKTKDLKNVTKTLLILIAFLTIFTVNVKAEDSNTLQSEDYSEEYKEWEQLNNDDKETVLIPRMFNIETETNNASYLRTISNPLKLYNLLKSSADSKYSLKTIIPENVAIRDQKNTNTCWDFAIMGALESTLGLKNYNNKLATKTYDFSERHMDYATLRDNFNNNAINDYGFTRTSSAGGNTDIALAYLTNGMGAIPESEMPFEDNSDKIDISAIENKTTSTTLKDTCEFAIPTTDEERVSTIASMKEYISNYGGIYAGIYGAKMVSDYYNNATGAIYCSSSTTTPSDHAVTIIGWDNDFSKDNFNTKNQPKANGAWIVKNSWGSKVTFSDTLTSVKENIYNNATQEVKTNAGWTSSTDVTNDQVIKVLEAQYGTGKISIENGIIYLIVGDNGYMYVSYEDANIYSALLGLQNVSDNKEYSNIYQNDLLGISSEINSTNTNDFYIANVFKRDSSNTTELLKAISINSYNDSVYEVYVGSSLNNLQKVNLAIGDNITVKAGYHQLELSEPVVLTGDSLVVAIKTKGIGLEVKRDGTYYANATVNDGETFYTFDANLSGATWHDLHQYSDSSLRGNACIKAFTDNTTVSSIAVSTVPTKVNYIQNKDSLDLAGGKIKVNYSSNSSVTLDMSNTNVKVTGFDNTKLGKQTLTVTYGAKTTTFDIEISAESAEVKIPVLTDITDLKAKISSINLNLSDSNSSKITISLSGIKSGDSNTTYSYYYYLSSVNNESNISNWEEINSIGTDGTANVDLTVNDLSKYSKLSSNDKLYMYVKEVANLGSTSKEQTSPAIEVSYTAEAEDNKNTSIDETVNTIKLESQVESQSSDTTTATTSIPQTGIIPISIIIITLVLILAITSFIRYKNIDK